MADVATHSNGVSTDPDLVYLDPDSSILGVMLVDENYPTKTGPLLWCVREARSPSSDCTFGSKSGTATNDACHINPDACAHRKI